MNDAHPARLVLAIVGRRWDEVDALLTRDGSAGAAFLAQCRECDVHPWVHHLLTERGWLERLGPEAAAGLTEMRAKVRRDNLLLLARAEQALDRLHDAGVVPLALKGLDLLHRLYGTFDQRTSDDVDLLVRHEELPAALEALRRAGWELPDEQRTRHYIRGSHHLPLRSGGPVPVEFELHWNLAQEQRYRIRPERLFAAAQPLSVAGRELLRLADADLVAHLLVHHFSHYFDRRLKWLVDLQLVAGQPEFSWDAVAATIREWQATAAAASSLRHLRRLQPELIPDSILQALPFAGWRRALTAPLLSRHPLELFRGTRQRGVQLYLAAVMLEHPGQLPGWLVHRSRRDHLPSENPLDPRGD